MKNVIIIGAGGHAKVIADIISKSNDTVLGFLDDNIEVGMQIIKSLKLNVIGKVSDIDKYKNQDVYFIIGIGNNCIREAIYNNYKGLKYYKAIHPSAIIGLDVEIGDGTVIMPNAVINSSTIIGKHCIINTASIIEHDNLIEDFVHISPNATLAGTVKVCKGTHIGVSATVKNNITIEKNNIIGAGAVVVKNIQEQDKVYIGIPAKIKK